MPRRRRMRGKACVIHTQPPPCSTQGMKPQVLTPPVRQ
ncbi:Hypothetical protein AA314_02671 [Archangium gephyra]|uniref:Uncharacterized protein n=1 Tax=Archangium gephyra TaxID=48 RepID=A0AAC8Q4P9_9BACT|nr:Hypothetical protein AA314_02671 [Archangium gephyra]